MSALMTSIAGLKGAQDRFETSARRIVAAGAEAGNRLTEKAQGTAPAAPATGSTDPVRGARPIGFAPDMAGAMVDMMQAENSFKANAAVAGRIADMQKAYLDVLGNARKER
jgi:ABC-type amino acid transport substrate-binding protein